MPLSSCSHAGSLVPVVLLLLGFPSLGFSQQANGKGDPKSTAGAPVTITALGDKLVVTSQDPEALWLIAELARQLTTATVGSGDFEVIHLKYANAVDAAKILDEMFNGPKPVGGTNAAGGGKGGGNGSAALSSLANVTGRKNLLNALANLAPQREIRIRIVPDSATNALIVQANPLDMLTIRDLLAKQLDSGVTDSDQIIKTFVIGPLQYAYASDVASVLRDVYRESMDNNSRRLGVIANPFTGATRSPTFNIDANGNPKGVSLSLSLDIKTNSLIVACPTSMCDDIKKLVSQMEVAAADTKQTVKIVRVSSIDPALVQQALDAIQGRSTSTRTYNGNYGQRGGGGNRTVNYGSIGLTPRGFGGGFPRSGSGFTNPTFVPGGGRGTGPAGPTKSSGG